MFMYCVIDVIMAIIFMITVLSIAQLIFDIYMIDIGSINFLHFLRPGIY